MKKSIALVSVLCALLAAGCQTTGPTAETGPPAGAQAEDQRLSKQELSTMIIGQTITYNDGSWSVIRKDGTYNYVGPNGETYPTSTYAITEDGAVCLKFPSGRSRCDTFVMSGETLVLINRQGARYTVVKSVPNV